MSPHTRRKLLATTLVWVSLTGLGAYVNAVAWSPLGDHAASSIFYSEHACKLVANIIHVLTLPGWLITWLGLGMFETGPAAALACGIGWACWIVAFWLIAWTRRRIRQHRSRSTLQQAKPTNAPEPNQTTPQTRPHHATTRRAFLFDSALITTGLAAGGVAAHATLVGPWSLVIRRYTIPIRDLPAALDGLRIIQIADTHLGPRIPQAHIAETVRVALSLQPDLVLLTGDYVHMGRAHIQPAAELFKPLTAPGATPVGVVGVLGNHDHYADGPAMSQALATIGIRMIDNNRVFIDVASRRLTPLPPTGHALALVGLGDLLEDTIDPRTAFADVPTDMPRIVLAHNPDTAELPALTAVSSKKFYPADPPPRTRAPYPPYRIDLMLSGHTHGGQVRIPFLGTPGIPSRFRQKYAHGLVQGPICPVLVSAGVGMSVLPVRWGVPPELVEITLTRASTPAR